MEKHLLIIEITNSAVNGVVDEFVLAVVGYFIHSSKYNACIFKALM